MKYEFMQKMIDAWEPEPVKTRCKAVVKVNLGGRSLSMRCERDVDDDGHWHSATIRWYG